MLREKSERDNFGHVERTLHSGGERCPQVGNVAIAGDGSSDMSFLRPGASDGGSAGFVARARELAEKYGERFEPPASLVEKAERGESYSDEQLAVAGV